MQDVLEQALELWPPRSDLTFKRAPVLRAVTENLDPVGLWYIISQGLLDSHVTGLCNTYSWCSTTRRSEHCWGLYIIHTGRATQHARKLEHFTFDIACQQCEHSHWQHQVPFAGVTRARPVWMGPEHCEAAVTLVPTDLLEGNALHSCSRVIPTRLFVNPAQFKGYGPPQFLCICAGVSACIRCGLCEVQRNPEAPSTQDAQRDTKQMEPVCVNRSVHTARKQHQSVCVRVCTLRVTDLIWVVELTLQELNREVPRFHFLTVHFFWGSTIAKFSKTQKSVWKQNWRQPFLLNSNKLSLLCWRADGAGFWVGHFHRHVHKFLWGSAFFLFYFILFYYYYYYFLPTMMTKNIVSLWFFFLCKVYILKWYFCKVKLSAFK